MSEADRTRDELLTELENLRERVAELERVDDGRDEPRRERHEDLLRAMHALVLETDPRGMLTHISSNAHELLGCEPHEMVGKAAREWVHADDLDRLAELQAKVISSGEGAEVRFRAQHRDGRWIWFEATGHPYRSEGGQIRILSFARDVTALLETADALQESEELLRAIGTRASDMVTVFDGDGRFLYVSPNREHVLGRSPDAFLGRTIYEVLESGELHRAEGERTIEGFQRLLTGEPRGHLEYRLRHADGSWRWLESTGTAYRTREGAQRVITISRDVTERVRAEERLRESEARYRVVVESTGNLVTEADGEGRLLYISENCEQVLGFSREELTGTTPLPLLVHPEDVVRSVEIFLDSVKEEKSVQTPPYRLRLRDGSWRWFETMSVPYRRDDQTHVLGVSRDITERIRAEEQRRELAERMQQTQRLESLGVMAGGIAHDFNNLLTPILGDSSLALMDLPEESPLRDQVQRIRRAAQRAAGLTHQMLAYAGRGPLIIESIDLSRLVVEMGQLLETAAAGRAILSFEMAADPPLVDGDVTQLSQVALNLITNATEAIGEAQGRICVRTGSVAAAAVSRSVLFQGSVDHETYVYFEVEDNGEGMNNETRSRIFDPFFTTKFTGRGLGLAAVLGIVRGHSGAIELESAPGRGTRFRVLLPARSDRPAVQATETVDTAHWRGKGTLLVVDDDDGVREVAGETLRRAGLSVLSACDGDEAVAIFQRHADRIDAVLLDRTMPGTSGEETFAALRRTRGDTPIILMSGYSQERAAEHFDERGLAGFLQKPFLPATLLSKVREVLDP